MQGAFRGSGGIVDDIGVDDKAVTPFQQKRLGGNFYLDLPAFYVYYFDFLMLVPWNVVFRPVRMVGRVAGAGKGKAAMGLQFFRYAVQVKPTFL